MPASVKKTDTVIKSDLINIDLLSLDGNIKIKITYDSQPVLFRIDPSTKGPSTKGPSTKGVTVELAGSVLIWTLPSQVLTQIQDFESIVRRKLCIEKEKFFEQQRKLFVSDSDIEYLWANAINTVHHTFRSFPEASDVESLNAVAVSVPNSGNTSNSKWTIPDNVTIFAKPSHIWISKSKCGIIWNTVVQ